ncbi:hypothetical protein PAEPH01_1061 [Pancytospora epiphaga]|nr:hypothetical protein PAEPH01_1061 [Pancytospora epiphaga]
MTAEIIDYLDNEDVEQLSEKLRGKLATASQIYRDTFEKCSFNATKACQSTMNQLREDVAKGTQRAIELEMELVKCKTDLASTRRYSHFKRVGGMNRKEVVVLRSRLKKILSKTENSLESDRGRSGANENVDIFTELERIREENCRLKENEQIYQMDIFKKANEILQLKGSNEDLKVQVNVMEQHRMNYTELHGRFICAELEQGRLNCKIAELNEALRNKAMGSTETVKSIEKRLNEIQNMLIKGNKDVDGVISSSKKGINFNSPVLKDIKGLRVKIESFQNEFELMTNESTRVHGYLLDIIRSHGNIGDSNTAKGNKDDKGLLDSVNREYKRELSEMKRRYSLSCKEVERLTAKCEELKKSRNGSETEANKPREYLHGSNNGPMVIDTELSLMNEDLQKDIRRKELNIERQEVLINKYRKLKTVTIKMMRYIEMLENNGK